MKQNTSISVCDRKYMAENIGLRLDTNSVDAAKRIMALEKTLPQTHLSVESRDAEEKL